jgi:predicted transglutaminase-like cysteine proteinase
MSIAAGAAADRDDRFDGGPAGSGLSRLLQPLPLALSVEPGAGRSLASLQVAGLRMTAFGPVERAPARAEVTGSIAKAPAPAAPARSAARSELLASVAIPFGRLPALERIAPAYSEIETDFLDRCGTILCENATATLKRVVAAGRNGRVVDLLAAVNRSVNRLITYRRDKDLYGTMDYWAKPSATLDRGMGDCEDYAILKMAVLAKAGVPARSMSVVILRDEKRQVYHAVTAVQTGSGFYILDNLEAELRKDTDLPSYMPLYSVSAGRGYIYGRRAGSTMLASAGGLKSVAPGEGLEPAAATMAATQLVLPVAGPH